MLPQTNSSHPFLRTLFPRATGLFVISSFARGFQAGGRGGQSFIQDSIVARTTLLPKVAALNLDPRDGARTGATWRIDVSTQEARMLIANAC